MNSFQNVNIRFVLCLSRCVLLNLILLTDDIYPIWTEDKGIPLHWQLKPIVSGYSIGNAGSFLSLPFTFPRCYPFAAGWTERIFQSMVWAGLELGHQYCSLMLWHSAMPSCLLYKLTVGRYRPVSYPDESITARCRFTKNAYWVVPLRTKICF